MPDIDFHIELLHWVLVNNFLKFNNDIYLQKYGTAMGTPAAVEYANTVLYFIEHSILDSYKPILYLRYIDDIFAIFPSTASAMIFIPSLTLNVQIFNWRV